MRVVQYKSQTLALPFPIVALILFLVQLVAGGFLAVYYINPDLFSGIANFNLIRAYHLNALILWLFSATFAAVFYLVPVLSGRELWGQGLVKLLAVILTIAVIGIFATLPVMQTGITSGFSSSQCSLRAENTSKQEDSGMY
jgi:nitric oxide reductase subunit B